MYPLKMLPQIHDWELSIICIGLYHQYLLEHTRQVPQEKSQWSTYSNWGETFTYSCIYYIIYKLYIHIKCYIKSLRLLVNHCLGFHENQSPLANSNSQSMYDTL